MKIPRRRIVEDLVAKASAMGAGGLNVEYKDGTEHVCAMKGQMGVGIAQFRSDGVEAQALREELARLSGKRGDTKVGEGEYTIRVENLREFRRDGVSGRDCGRVRRDGRSAEIAFRTGHRENESLGCEGGSEHIAAGAGEIPGSVGV